MREVISAAIIHDNRILLVRKKQTWILPGGKPDGEESDIECLEREILKEELPDERLGKLTISKFYDSFTGKTPHTGDIAKVFVYVHKLKTTFFRMWYCFECFQFWITRKCYAFSVQKIPLKEFSCIQKTQNKPHLLRCGKREGFLDFTV